jgi:hypothetical protein
LGRCSGCDDQPVTIEVAVPLKIKRFREGNISKSPIASVRTLTAAPTLRRYSRGYGLKLPPSRNEITNRNPTNSLIVEAPRRRLHILVTSIILSMVAYLLYLKGVPGSPRLPYWEDTTGGLGTGRKSDDSAITILAPPETEIHQTVELGQARYANGNGGFATFDVRDPVLHLDPNATYIKLDVTRSSLAPFNLILNLEAGARIRRTNGLIVDDRNYWSNVENVSVRAPVSQSYLNYENKENDDYLQFDSQLITLNVTPYHDAHRRSNGFTVTFGLMLHTIWPFAVRDNDRLAIRSPLMNGSITCPNIDEVAAWLALSKPLTTTGTFLNPKHCILDNDRPKQEALVVLDLEKAEWRPDIVFPQPGEESSDEMLPEGVTWWTASQPIRVRANYANINDATRGQKFLFISGVLAGLAAGLIPISLEGGYKSIRASSATEVESPRPKRKIRTKRPTRRKDSATRLLRRTPTC